MVQGMGLSTQDHPHILLAPILWLKHTMPPESLLVRRGILALVICLIIAANVTAQLPVESIGYYLIRSNVDGAAVSFDGSYQGMIQQGVLLVPIYPGSLRYTGYTVQKEGYTVFTGTIPSMPGNSQTLEIPAILSPLPAAQGSLYVVTDPPGAAIYLNGKFEGTSPLTISDLQSGIYTLLATLDSYSPCISQVTVFPAKQAVVNCNLNAVFGPGTIVLSSAPPGAKVSLDGLSRGVTPLTIMGAAPIDHVVEFDLPLDIPAGPRS
jgi:hypothetical protein